MIELTRLSWLPPFLSQRTGVMTGCAVAGHPTDFGVRLIDITNNYEQNVGSVQKFVLKIKLKSTQSWKKLYALYSMRADILPRILHF